MALKMLTSITGNFVTCLKSTRNGKAAANITLNLPAIPWPWFFTQQLSHNAVKSPAENLELVTRLENMGVDLTVARKQYVLVLKQDTTYEKHVEQFLTDKGSNKEMVASIISRYPPVILCLPEVLDEMWNIWRQFMGTDATILSVAERTPKHFFKTSNTERLGKNIYFFMSLSLPPKLLMTLMVRSPTTFANNVDINKQKVAFLRRLCSQLGGTKPHVFVRDLLTSNIFMLTKSRNLIQANVEAIKSLMKLEDYALLLWIQGSGACTLTLCYGYFEKHYKGVHAVLQSLGCTESEISLYILSCPKVLLMTPNLFKNKMAILMDFGVSVGEILNFPTIMTVHIDTLKFKLKALKECGYDFRASTLHVLLLSQTIFISKLEKLHNP